MRRGKNWKGKHEKTGEERGCIKKKEGRKHQKESFENNIDAEESMGGRL